MAPCRSEENTELIAALRHCDGEHAGVLVRDDFWMAATRFMRDLEIRLLEGENSAPLISSTRHATKGLGGIWSGIRGVPKTSDT